jgi:2-dehydro-3-deoxygluconokinase
MISLKKDCSYALLTPTSMGVRLTPADGQPVHCSRTFVKNLSEFLSSHD